MAHPSNDSHNLQCSKFVTPSSLKSLALACIGIGVITFAAGFAVGTDRVWPAYLTALYYFSCLGLGGLFFVALNYVAKAGWSTSIRRLAESMTSFLPVMLIGSLILVVGLKKLFPWADPEKVAADPGLQTKSAYLNMGFMIVRMLFFGLGCLAFRKVLIGNSIKQDQSGDHELTHSNGRFAIAFMPFFALLFSLFSVDLIMSLLPNWYSTIFGIYCFSGLIQSFFAALALLVIFIKRSGLVKGYITDEHQHDVAKFMKGFTVFWAYIAFSQFMLIWYANIPEETEYYLMRSQNGWLGISMGLLIFRFIVPFIALLPRGWKRNENHLIAVSILILIMQYVDIYWMVYPNFHDGMIEFGVWEVGIFVGFLGFFLLGIFRFLSSNNLVALRDPRLHEAINHHVTY